MASDSARRTSKRSNLPTPVDDAELARTAAYPHLVVRIYCAVYQREDILIEHTLGVPIAQIGHKGCLVLHTEPFNADGTVSAACRKFLINCVQEAVNRLKYRMCIVWAPKSCTFVEINAAPLESTEPPSGGLTLPNNVVLQGATISVLTRGAHSGTGNPTHGISHTALRLLRLGIPVTVENWLNFNYPDNLPDPVPAEILAEAEEAVASVQQWN